MSTRYSQEEILGSVDRRISYRQAMTDNYRIIDVRSPGEYEGGTIPGAINIPVFDGEERSLVGTIYRHAGQGPAIDRGFALVNDKLEQLIEALEPYRREPLAVFCARGGMRSRSMVNLLNRSGFNAAQIEGGYKKYRNDVLTVLADLQPELIIIHGLTGTGKTRVLQRLDPAIDLEDLAGHRSSLFGAMGLQPANQRSFESRLVKVIEELGPQPWFIEGESRKIGRVFIPKPLAQAMKQGHLVKIDCSVETRIDRIIEDYPVEDDATRRQVEKILRSLKRNLGAELVEKMCDLLWRDELRELVHILLVEYYDRRYGRSMANYRYVFETSSEEIDRAARELRDFRSELLRMS